MTDPQIAQSTPIAVLKSGERVKFTAEWIRILNRLVAGTSAPSTGGVTTGQFTDALARITLLEADLTALKQRVKRLEEGYQT
jgi:hypothetical protein